MIEYLRYHFKLYSSLQNNGKNNIAYDNYEVYEQLKNHECMNLG